MVRFALTLCILCGLISGVSGCGNTGDAEDTASAKLDERERQPEFIVRTKKKKVPDRRRMTERPRKTERPFRSSLLDNDGRFDEQGTGGGGDWGNDRRSDPQHPGLGEREALSRIEKVIQDSVEYAPTLVVWLIDTSPSAMRWHGGTLNGIKDFCQTNSREDDRLLWAVVGFGQSTTFLTEQPTTKADEVTQAISGLKQDDSGIETPFAAVQQSVDKFIEYRTRQRREVVLVVVTDEAGDDADQLRQVIKKPKANEIPVYVMGVPAPLGRIAALEQTVEGGQPDGPIKVRQGPAAPGLQRIHLEFVDDFEDFDLVDSGFGPYGLECLARETGGLFIAIRPGWPRGNTRVFDPQVMRKYRPKTMSQDEYMQLVNSNGVYRALHEASQLPKASVMRNVVEDFNPSDPAALKRALDDAQRAPAKVSSDIDMIYDTIWRGAGDREQVKDPRVAASYDLALGRIAAAKARVDGYNEMLASLKRGKTFENANSSTWVLVQDDSIEASSALRNLIQRAQDALNRVVQEHAGTPWAYLAQQELQHKMGWKWIER